MIDWDEVRKEIKFYTQLRLKALELNEENVMEKRAVVNTEKEKTAQKQVKESSKKAVTPTPVDSEKK